MAIYTASHISDVIDFKTRHSRTLLLDRTVGLHYYKHCMFGLLESCLCLRLTEENGNAANPICSSTLRLIGLRVHKKS